MAKNEKQKDRKQKKKKIKEQGGERNVYVFFCFVFSSTSLIEMKVLRKN